MENTRQNCYERKPCSAAASSGRYRFPWVAAACRRVIRANRLGWRKHGDAADMQLILDFA